MGNVCGGGKATRTVENGQQPGAKGEKATIYFNRMSPPASATMVIAKMVAEGMFNAQEIDLMAGEQKKPDYLKINPSGTVPAFKKGELLIGESRAIQLMAIRAHGFSDKMEGNTPQERARSTQALFWESSTLAPNVIKVAKPVVFEGKSPNEEHIKEFFDGPIKHLNGILAGCMFMAGDNISVADISAVFHLGLLAKLIGAPFCKMLMDCEHVSKWLTGSLGGCQKFCDAVCWMEKTYPGGLAGAVKMLIGKEDKIKLTYWPGRGRAHMSRMLLHFKGVDFDDCFMDGAKWPEIKAGLGDRLIYPNLPFLEEGDITITESYAILKYLGRKFQLAPKCEAQQIMADQVTEFLSDSFGKVVKIAFEKDEGAKKEAYKALCEGAVQQWTPMDGQLGKCKWSVGDDCTYVDFAMCAMVSLYCDWVPELSEKCSNLCKIEKQLRAESASLDKYLNELEFKNLPKPEL